MLRHGTNSAAPNVLWRAEGTMHPSETACPRLGERLLAASRWPPLNSRQYVWLAVFTTWYTERARSTGNSQLAILLDDGRLLESMSVSVGMFNDTARIVGRREGTRGLFVRFRRLDRLADRDPCLRGSTFVDAHRVYIYICIVTRIWKTSHSTEEANFNIGESFNSNTTYTWFSSLKIININKQI